MPTIVCPPLYGLYFAIACCFLPVTVLAKQTTPASKPVEQTPNERLYDGAEHGDLARIQAALHDGANVNARFEYQETPLMAACREGNVEAVALLLRQHPDVNFRNSRSITALHLAARSPSGYVNEIKTLGVHAAFRLGGSRLYRIMEMLIAAGAKVNARTENLTPSMDYNGTPLHVLAYSLPGCGWENDLGRLELLARNGADLNAQNSDGATALHIAAKRHDPMFLCSLLRLHANPNLKDNQGQTPLMCVDWGYASYKALVEGGANVNVRDKAGRTLLIRLFEDAAKSRTAGYSDNENVIHPEAIRLPDEKVVRLLIHHNASGNVADAKHHTALQYARQLAAECEEAQNRQQMEHLVRLLQNAGAKH